MAEERPIGLSTTGPPEHVLPSPPDLLAGALAASTTRDEVASVVARFPTWSLGWAELGDQGRDAVERYAAYRVGYHRGLDLMRQSGWRGSGYLRWAAEPNRGFLRCLVGLSAAAAEIDERSEVERIDTFIEQLDPGWDRSVTATDATDEHTSDTNPGATT
ncbi:MAG: DUF3151 family protein [Microthrixaceae bacterium]|nr:DUF3151 family protein [Microthrixaceae bacterium]